MSGQPSRIDALFTKLRRQAAMRLLREHSQRPGVDTAPLLGQEGERVVRLAGVRRTEVRDDRLRLGAALRQADRDTVLRPLHCGALVRARRPRVAGGARRASRGA